MGTCPEVVSFLAFEGETSTIVDGATIVLIDARALVRDCLAQCLRASDPDCLVLMFDTVEQWLESGLSSQDGSLVLLAAGGRGPTEKIIEHDLSRFTNSEMQLPVVIISDTEDFDCVLGALQRGAKGYIPTSLGLKVTIGAIHLVKVGGTFVPANALMAARQPRGRASDIREAARSGVSLSQFSTRQMAVVNALRQGKANKVIAYELNMCESTVKVHVRNIMKKLKAKNRTEVAYICNNKISPANGKSAAEAEDTPLRRSAHPRIECDQLNLSAIGSVHDAVG